MTALEIARDDLSRTRLVPEPAYAPQDGEVVLRVDRFGLTANNITYGLLGDALGYWSFFPAEPGWGRIPVWGFAEVAASAHDALPAGARVFGYCPMASQLVLRPVFFLAFMLDDFLAAHEQFGAETVVLSSASSKSALGTAFLLQRRGVRVTGLTSARNRAFVEGVGVYAAVATYDDVGTLARDPAAFANLAGNAAVRAAVHRHYGDRLLHSAVVGATHQDASTAPAGLPGPAPEFFFVPDRLRDRTRDWGAAGLEERSVWAWQPYVAWCDEWLSIERRAGAEAVRDAYAKVLRGATAPDRAYALSLA